ncbi:hypothetical protein [Cupriavidus sp. TMH.W2]|uniref:hypothetical protein n=1 Tax=Cupriavidus sp. TMH.W2 TaxID=3434465 RepID=UPI003D779F43
MHYLISTWHAPACAVRRAARCRTGACLARRHPAPALARQRSLHEFYDNVSNPVLRVAGKIALWGLRPSHRLRDSEKLAIADALGDPRVIQRLCPDIGMPGAGGLRNLLPLAQELGEEES